MPMLDCPELAELDLEPVGASFIPQSHHPHGTTLPPAVPSTPAMVVVSGAPSTSVVTKPKYSVRKAVKIESDLNHHQNENHHPHLGVRTPTKFKHIVSDPPENAWMAMMEAPALHFQHHIQQQQQLQQQHHLQQHHHHHHHQQHHQQQHQQQPQQQQQQQLVRVEDRKTTKAISATPIDSKLPIESRRYYPAPYCSCTGANQQCYRWGNGGWQSACCTTKISIYPLPMNPKKKGSRVAGRKMSAGAFRKLLDRLANEGVDVNLAVDLRPHWAKHGTNRYVTIK